MHRVVILGASYAGISAMRRLGGESGISITLVDQHPYHFLQTEGYELISGEVPFDETIVSIEALCANYDNVAFVHARVLGVERRQKQVLLEGMQIRYDTLIIALGSVTRLFECGKDVFNYSGGAKSLRGALRLKQFFEEELYKRLESSKKAKETFHIVVGGAGLSGVEIAAGMQAYFNRYYRSNTLSCATLHIHLIASREEVLHGMHPRVIAAVTKRLDKLRVKVHRQRRIKEVHAHEAVLDDDSVIAFDFMIFAGGTVVAPVLDGVDLPRHRSGRFEVDAYLRSRGDHDIYMAGDVAALHDRKGAMLPPTAQTAIKSGRAAAENILRLLNARALEPANLSLDGIAIALGGRYAVIAVDGMYLGGQIAYLIKKLIEKRYKWPLWWLARKGYGQIASCQL